MNTSGIIEPPASPCNARNAIMLWIFHASPHSMLVIVNPAADAANSATRPISIPIFRPVSPSPGMKVRGHVLTIGAGTGSEFSVLPAQNATGNWIKVVQRLPVRIQLDPKELAEHPLRVGLSMEAKIDLTSK